MAEEAAKGEDLYQGRAARVLRYETSDRSWMYQVVATGYIEVETRSVDLANGIAGALDATTPEGAAYSRDRSLATLADLVEARHLLASIVDAEAARCGRFSDAVKGVAERLYGRRR